jgi:hypothetical protein
MVRQGLNEFSSLHGFIINGQCAGHTSSGTSCHLPLKGKAKELFVSSVLRLQQLFIGGKLTIYKIITLGIFER